MNPSRTFWLRAMVGLSVALVLLATLTLYQRPDFLIQLADQAWSCF